MKSSAIIFIRKIIFLTIRLLGLPFLFRNLVQKNKITILLFHDISAETAKKSFNFLTRKYNIISLKYFLNAAKDKKNYPLPKKAMVITFDDGFSSNYKLTEVFRENKIPVTIFLCAGLVDTNRHFWFEENNSNYSFKELKKMSNTKMLKILTESGFDRQKEYKSTRILSKKQIEDMRDIVDFQSHTLFHPCLPNCGDADAFKEISDSKKILDNQYGLNIYALAYPNGDYSDRDIEFARESGYTCALTVDYGFNNTNTDLFRLRRLCVNDTDDINELIVKASGFWDYIKTRNGKLNKTQRTYLES